MGATRADDLPEPVSVEIETRSVVKEELLLPEIEETGTPTATSTKAPRLGLDGTGSNESA
jgi:hypothetical protein